MTKKIKKNEIEKRKQLEIQLQKQQQLSLQLASFASKSTTIPGLVLGNNIDQATYENSIKQRNENKTTAQITNELVPIHDENSNNTVDVIIETTTASNIEMADDDTDDYHNITYNDYSENTTTTDTKKEETLFDYSIAFFGSKFWSKHVYTSIVSESQDEEESLIPEIPFL